MSRIVLTMNSTKDITKPATQPALLKVLVALRAAGRATAKQVNSNAIYLARLEKDGLVKVAGKVESGQRGRPAHIYAVTKKGGDRARRAAARA